MVNGIDNHAVLSNLAVFPFASNQLVNLVVNVLPGSGFPTLREWHGDDQLGISLHSLQNTMTWGQCRHNHPPIYLSC